ncbi:hypothetical protein BJ912DRAFT_1042521 [Pholiota molesta]|nr:hypothetical protein BJ912DRAFT_1042521 [Pholiota molesta]
MSELRPTADIEKSEIGSSLNAFILGVFGMGMYTIIYFGTMYIHLTRSASKRYIVPATITALFACNILFTAVNWYITKWQFVDNGGTQESVFLSLFEIPGWMGLATDIPYYLGFVLADGLLIWRCFFVWNQSLRAIAVPVLLLTAEIVIFIVRTILQARYGVVVPTARLTAQINSMAFAGYFTTFATSFVTTLLIAYRIHAVATRGTSQRRFRHITAIVVESGAVYSLSLLFGAITTVVAEEMTVTVLNTRVVASGYYQTVLVNLIAGIATTILVARVAMLGTTTSFPSTSIHLSGLQFHARSTHETHALDELEAAYPVSVKAQ